MSAPMGFDELFSGRRVMAILRGMPQATTLELASRAWDLGITAVEVPIQTPGAVAVLRAVVAAGAERGLPVGAGTVIAPEQVEAASAAGAGFTVAPGYDPAVADACHARGLAHLPGVSTPSDIQRVLRRGQVGQAWVKAFPASVLGTGWFAAMRGPFPKLRIVATGGVHARNAGAFLEAGADVVAVGSALEDPAQIDLLAELLHR